MILILISSCSYVCEHQLLFFRILAINPHTNKSKEVQVDVALCTGCSDRGYCTNNTDDRMPADKFYFKYAKCVCEDQYEGNFI